MNYYYFAEKSNAQKKADMASKEIQQILKKHGVFISSVGHDDDDIFVECSFKLENGGNESVYSDIKNWSN